MAKNPADFSMLMAYSAGALFGMPTTIYLQSRTNNHTALAVSAAAFAVGFGVRSYKISDVQRRLIQMYVGRGCSGMAATSLACWLLGLYHGIDDKKAK